MERLILFLKGFRFSSYSTGTSKTIKRIFFYYTFVATALTIIRVNYLYVKTHEQIKLEIEREITLIKPVLSAAIWNEDEESYKLIIESLFYNNNYFKHIKIISSDRKTRMQIGDNNFQKFTYTISKSLKLSENENAILLLKYNASKILKRIKSLLILTIIMSIIKYNFLWFLLYYYLKKYFVTPLMDIETKLQSLAYNNEISIDGNSNCLDTQNIHAIINIINQRLKNAR